MTGRTIGGTTYTLSYDAENRLTGVSGSKTATFTYDGDGKLVKTQVGSVYVAIPGPHYQYSGTTVTKHYYADGVRLAERVADVPYFLLTDHLGSTAITTDGAGNRYTELRYYPYGKPRYFGANNQTTDYRFTGQRWQGDIGLYYYNARWYDHLIGRFTSPDTIVPNPGNPGSLNRYSYVLNNPLRYRDPSGHAPQYPGDPDPDNAPCSTSWCWQNRWYRAHGFDWNENTNHWSTPTAAIEFYDEGIAQEFFTEFDIALSGPWALSQLNLVGQGMVDFYRKIGSAGRLVQLIGRGNRFIRSGNGAGPCSVTHAACTWFSTVWFYDELFTHSDSFVKGTVVHELAHVIDFISVIPSHASRGEQDIWFFSVFWIPPNGYDNQVWAKWAGGILG